MTIILLASFPTSSALIAPLSFIAPMAAIVGGLWMESRNRERRERPPQPQKLLRPAGHTLANKLDDSVFTLICHVMGAVVLASIPILFVQIAMEFMKADLPMDYAALSFSAAALMLLAALWQTRRTQAILAQARNYRLGLRGEQAVAEALVTLSKDGYQAFHDVPGDGKWNVDHVIVGPKGVFAIETKARSKRIGGANGPDHVVRHENDTLHFPTGDDNEAIPQARRNARWVADYLTKKTGERVPVGALLLIPGWYVEGVGREGNDVDVKNPNYLVKCPPSGSMAIADAQVRRIAAALEERCRDVEF